MALREFVVAEDEVGCGSDTTQRFRTLKLSSNCGFGL